MSKGLEALKNIKREKPTFFSAIYDSDMWEEDTKTIEKELKALEVIKEKRVNMYILRWRDVTCKQYNERMDMYGLPTGLFHLTQEEFDLVKEALACTR